MAATASSVACSSVVDAGSRVFQDTEAGIEYRLLGWPGREEMAWDRLHLDGSTSVLKKSYYPYDFLTD